MPAVRNDEITLFDLADWLWAYRLMALFFVLVAAVWTALLFFGSPPKSIGDRQVVEVRIFASGTPVRNPDEISAMIASIAVLPDTKLLTKPGETPVRVEVANEDAAKSLEEGLHALEQFLIDEVSRQTIETEKKLQSNDAALPLYLRAKSFDDGVNEGYIDPIAILRENPLAAEQSISPARLSFPAAVCFVAFLTLALFTTFLKKWRAHRRFADK